MRRGVFIIILLIIELTLIMGTYNSCFAANKKMDITSDNFKNEWNPNKPSTPDIWGRTVDKGTKPLTDLIVFITNRALGIIQIAAGFLMVLCIAITGFNIILTSDNHVAFDVGLNPGRVGTQRRLIDFNRRLLIGTVLVFASVTIVRIVFNLLTSF